MGGLLRTAIARYRLPMEILDWEAEAWWAAVIAALERDLYESTKFRTGDPPDHDPTPSDPRQATPAQQPRSSGRSSRRNLNDLLED